jgi:hypothetical protein
MFLITNSKILTLMKRLLIAIFAMLAVVGAQAQLPNFFPHEGKYSEFQEAINADKSFSFVKETKAKSNSTIYSEWEGMYQGELFSITINYSALTNDILSVRMSANVMSNTMRVFLDVADKMAETIGRPEFYETNAYWDKYDIMMKVDGTEITIYYSNSVNKAIHEREIKRRQ